MNTSVRHHSTPTLLLAIVAGMLAVACHEAPPPAATGAPPSVGTVTIAAQTLTLTTELPGRTSAYLVAEIRPQVHGIIQKRPFTEGADVKAGTLLYQIDPAPYRAAFDQAKAALAVAEARLPALRSRSERLAELAEARAVGQQDADDAAAALAQAEAEQAAAKAALESARVNLSYTPITAPISGRIGRSAVTIGALVTAYQPTPLAVIQQLDPIYVDVTQASVDLLGLQRALGSGALTNGDSGRTVSLTLEDGTPYPHEGTLEFRDVTVDPTTATVTLRMTFPNPDHLLLPGMYVRATVEEGVLEHAILAPQEGVLRDRQGRPMAWVVGKDSAVEQRMLELDRAIGDKWLVREGLEVGDRLIVTGRQKVRPGAAVSAAPASTDQATPAGEAPTGAGAR